MSPNPLSLPSEILEQIFAHVTSSHRSNQHTLYACTLVSRSWYSNSIPFLYDSPLISGKNYDSFVRAICPSVNAHIRTNGLAELVRRLDMSALVHNGSKSLTARLLGRVKRRLEEFVAPQASFAINCLAALSKCSNLRRLDLSLVSESIAISDLLRSIHGLPKLSTLHLPRSSVQNTNVVHPWPANLCELHISGGLRDTEIFHTLPPCLSSLSISNCSHLSVRSTLELLKTLSTHLRTLALLAPILSFKWLTMPLQAILLVLPHLSHLKISLDILTADCFHTDYDPGVPFPPSLVRLDLHCFDPAECQHITPSLIFDALGLGVFTRLRVIGVHSKLGWETNENQPDLADIDNLLKAFAREDQSGSGIPEAEAGVVSIKKF